jgi:hypothetical protein
VWQYTTVISALRGLREEDGEFKDSLGYTERPCLKANKQTQKLPKKEKWHILYYIFPQKKFFQEDCGTCEKKVLFLAALL